MNELDQQIMIFIQTGKTWEEIRSAINYPDSEIACRYQFIAHYLDDLSCLI